MNTLLSIGHGYSARALGRHLLAQGWRVIGTTRGAETAAELAAEGVEARIWTGGPLPLDQATHLLSSVAPDAAGDPVLRDLGEAIAAAGHLRWVGYLSTAGVYGDHAGGWVDEETPCHPATARGQARVGAERDWRALPQRAHLFRLAGIFGPGRGPLAQVRNVGGQRGQPGGARSAALGNEGGAGFHDNALGAGEGICGHRPPRYSLAQPKARGMTPARTP